jgi:hypothetical protein
MRHSRSVSFTTVAELKRVHETKIQDGTLNYTLLPAVTTGLRLLGAYLPALPARMAALSTSCARLLKELRWPRSDTTAVRVLSRIPGEPPEPGEASQGAGGVIACLMFDVRDLPARKGSNLSRVDKTTFQIWDVGQR